jgi:hypothetical protein
MSQIIELSRPEALLCQQIGIMRRLSNRGSRVADAQVGKQDPWQIDVDGVVGEYAVAKAMNLFFDPTIEIRAGGADLIARDGKTIDVKTSRHKDAHLQSRLEKAKNPCDFYFLVIVDGWVAEIIGFAKKGDLFQEANIKDVGHGPGYLLAQEYLIPFPYQRKEKAA